MPSRKVRSSDCENEAQSENRRNQNREAQRRHRDKLRQSKAVSCGAQDVTRSATGQGRPQTRNGLFDVDQSYHFGDFARPNAGIGNVTSFADFPTDHPLGTSSLLAQNVLDPVVSPDDAEVFLRQLSEIPFHDHESVSLQGSSVQAFSSNQGSSQNRSCSVQQIRSQNPAQSPGYLLPSSCSHLGCMQIAESGQPNIGRQRRQSSLTEFDHTIIQLLCDGKTLTDTPICCALQNEPWKRSGVDTTVEHSECSCGISRAERIKPESMARKLRELYASGVDLGCLPPDEAALRILLTLEERFRGLTPAHSR
ncbi:hypothetical protein K431DRAFT_290177 [Polychaeton citri CBS 116435]|uniref:BZIP domain-containing protein n=1 Tax=Polychaeton citri CBS 116435 TaxID=1314669 RepID=A0A9P4UV25_9PEZI|nr:hypothetical protein K431DRAFT_290177 [Polychaeton citri CBS 116435]